MCGATLLPMDEGARAGVVAIVTNLGLAVAKLVVGTIGGSAALVADGFNSAGDVFASGIGLLGYRLGQDPPDANHPYGHGNVESVAGLVIGIMLLATGVFISIDGVRVLLSGPREAPALMTLWVALGTAVVKEVLYRYTTIVGTRLNSPSLLASARDHRADVLIAITVAAGVAGARLAVPWLDPLAAVVVGGWIARIAVQPIRVNFGVLMDESPPGVTSAVRSAAASDPAVRRVDVARVHPLGSYYIVDLEIALDSELNLLEGHDIAHRVADRVRTGVPHVREVRVHVNPA